MITELTDEHKIEINKLLEQYSKDKDIKKLLEALEEYAYPDGSLTLYIRWQLDNIR